jgi:hypothetical protein
MFRSVIRAGGVLALAGLAGCADAGPLVPPAAQASASASASGITYALALTGSRFDEAGDRTVFTYAVTSNPAGGPAISHWVLALPSCVTAADLAGSSDPLASFVSPDPTTGVRGVKFDTGYRDGETRTVTVSFRGLWFTDGASVAVKAGTGFVTGTADGPGCPTTTVASAPPTHTISGVVYLDANGNGARGADEPGIPGVRVALAGGAEVVTGADGGYRFTALPQAAYTVASGGVAGTTPATAEARSFAALVADTTADFGYRVDLAALAGRTANGFTIGYWKNNLDKAVAGTTKGIQVSAATLRAHVATLSTFALRPFTFTTLREPAVVLAATGSAPTVLLSKQLLASELNYANGAFIGGDARLTALFLYHGEYMLVHPAQFTSAELLAAKSWYDAYNNSHGGAIVAPAAP